MSAMIRRFIQPMEDWPRQFSIGCFLTTWGIIGWNHGPTFPLGPAALGAGLALVVLCWILPDYHL